MSIDEFDYYCTHCFDLLTLDNWPERLQKSLGEGGSGRRLECLTCSRYLRNIRNKNRKLFHDTLFEKQNGCCDMCGMHASQTNRGLFVDHNHETDQPRALLCSRCNSYIGFLENQKMNKMAREYLKKHENYSLQDPNGQIFLDLGKYVWVTQELDH